MVERTAPKVAVLGAGGVGAHLAARLHLAGANVTLIARGRTLEAVQDRGLTLLAGEETHRVDVAVTDDPRALAHQDLWIVSVKERDLRIALERVAPCLSPASRVLFVMNGLPWWFHRTVNQVGQQALQSVLNVDPALEQLVSCDQVLWGVIVAGGVVIEPGVVRNTTPGRNALEIGAPSGLLDDELHLIVSMVEQAGFRASASAEIHKRIWAKLLLNAGQAMVATACERTPLKTVSDPETRGLVVATMEEILEVGRAIGIRIDADPIAMTEPSRSASHQSSFLQDLHAGRPLELNTTILAVRDVARVLNVPVPSLSAVAAIVAARSNDASAPSTNF